MVINPAGGLVYHWRAYKYSAALWTPFRQSLDLWLERWATEVVQKQERQELVIMGPSAGYCLSARFLKRFSSLCCIEPDPLARAVFEWRLRRAKEKADSPRVRWVTENFFSPHDGAKQGLRRFSEFVRAGQDRAVLFSNVLGQLTSLVSEARHDEVIGVWREGLLRSLGALPWASFHDRFSGGVHPELSPANAWFPRRLKDEELLERFYSNSGHGQLLDHFMEGFFPSNLAHVYLPWRLTPNTTHLVEGVHSTA